MLPVIPSMDSDKDSVGKGIGGRSWGFSTSSGVSPSRSTDRPSSVESDMRGRSSTSSCELIFSGTGGGTVDDEGLEGENERLLEPCVLLLNLEGRGWLDEVLSRLLETVPDLIIILCRAVRSSTFFSALGKYSVKWLVISSLGGRWPKKFCSFDGLFAFTIAGLNRPDVGGGSNALSGSCTPRPLRILIELARFVFMVEVEGAAEGLLRPSSFCTLRTVKPFSRVGWSGARQIESSSASVRGRPAESLSRDSN